MDPRKRTLEEELKALYAQVPPPPGGLVEGRKRMFAEAAQRGYPPLVTEGNRLPLFRRLRMAPAFRALVVCAVVVLTLALAGGSALLASGASLPGDMLYPVKLAVEDFRLSLTADPATRAERSMRFVGERVEEMRGLTDKGEMIPDGVVTRMEQQIDRVVIQAAAASPEQAPGLVECLREGMRLQGQALEQMRAGSSPEDQTALNAALRITERAYQAADLAKGDPKRLEYEYLHQGRPEEPGAEAPQPEYNDQHQNQNGEEVGDPQEAPAPGEGPGPGTGTGAGPDPGPGSGPGSGPGTGTDMDAGADTDTDTDADTGPGPGPGSGTDGGGPESSSPGGVSGTWVFSGNSVQQNSGASSSEAPLSVTKGVDEAPGRRRN
jgi:hypothetical protein